MTLRRIAAAAALALALLPAAPAFAQDEVAILTNKVFADDAPVPFDLEASLAALPPVDADRLAVAERIVVKLLPPGAMEALMRQMFGETMTAMVDGMAQMPIATFARAFGLDEESVAALDEGTLGELLDIYDPYWRERQQREMASMAEVMVKVADRMEPAIRSLMARAYARNFTMDELLAIEAFFATPAGTTYASKSLMLAVEPDFARDMTALMPALMGDLAPVFAAMNEGAVDGLPEPRSYDDLTPAQRKRLAELLGVDEDDLWAPEEK